MKDKKRMQVDLGLLAMPLFCSLLGAILILVLTGSSTSPPPLAPEQIQEMLGKLAQARLVIAQGAALQNVVSNRLDLAEYRAANTLLDDQIGEKLAEIAQMTNDVSQPQILQARLDEIRRQAETAAADAAAARDRIADLEARARAAKTNSAVGLIASYRGSLVLIECEDQQITIHPGGRTLATDAPERDFDPVFAEIDKAGFVALAARPGAFDKSYDRIHHLVEEHVADLNKKRATPIGFCAFPLDKDAPITTFLPEGTTK